jgi:alkylation response protein AidB-like acyl-CoA dehydrogenase
VVEFFDLKARHPIPPLLTPEFEFSIIIIWNSPMSVDEIDLAAATDELIVEFESADATTFLGAQYDAGLAWVAFPNGFGGRDAPAKMQAIVDERLENAGRLADWMRNPMGIGMVGPAIAEWGTDEQRDRLRKIFTAEELWCQLFSEPGAGSDVASLSTRAVLDGDEWTVNGQKVWTSLAHQASFGLIITRTNADAPKHAGMTAFIVDMHAPGVEVRPLRQMSGDHHFNEVYFTDVRIPDSYRVGAIDAGWSVAVSTLMNERVSIGGKVVPRGSGRIATAVATWQEFGHLQPARRGELLRLWSEAEILRLSSIRARALRERGTPGPEGSILKLAGAVLDRRIMSFAVDLAGAYGTLVPGYVDIDPRENRELDFLRAQSSTIAGGTTEVMKNIIGERVLGLPPDIRVDKNLPWSEVPRSG